MLACKKGTLELYWFAHNTPPVLICLRVNAPFFLISTKLSQLSSVALGFIIILKNFKQSRFFVKFFVYFFLKKRATPTFFVVPGIFFVVNQVGNPFNMAKLDGLHLIWCDFYVCQPFLPKLLKFNVAHEKNAEIQKIC